VNVDMEIEKVFVSDKDVIMHEVRMTHCMTEYAGKQETHSSQLKVA
jgi:hypothetical protein